MNLISREKLRPISKIFLNYLLIFFRLDQKYKNRMKDLLTLHKNQMNEMMGPSKSMIIKNDKFMKTNKLSNKI